jgi:hypothetical protein
VAISELEIKVHLEKEKAEREAREMSRNMAGSMHPIIEAAGKVGLAWQGVTAIAGDVIGVVQRIGDAVWGAVKAFDEATAADRRATFAIEGFAGGSVRTTDALREMNNALQQKLGLDADNLIAMQGTLALLGVLPRDLEVATKATIGLAEVTGQDLNAAATSVAKVFQGNIGHLGRMGIRAKDAGEAVEKLAGYFQLAEQNADSTSTRVKALTANLGDLFEAAGKFVSGSGAAGVADKLSSWFARLAERVNENADKVAILRAELAGTFVAAPLGPGEPSVSPADAGAVAQAKADALKAQADAKEKARSERRVATRKRTVDDLIREDRRLEAQEKAWVDGIHARANAEAMASLQAEEQRARMAGEVAERKRAWAAELASSEADAAELREERRKQELEAERAHWASLVSIGVNGVASWIGGMAEAMGRGDNLITAAGSLLGGLMVQLGQAAIGMGTVGLLAATLGSVAPWLVPMTGGPASIGPAIALIAGGVGLVAAGSALGAASSGAGAVSAAAGGGGGGGSSRSWGGSAAPPSVPTGYSAGSSATSIATTINVNVQGIVSGSAREVGRWIGDRLRDAGTLSPAPVRY